MELSIGVFYYNLLTKSSKKGGLTTWKRKIRFIFRTICCIPYSINLINFVYKHKYLSEKVLTYTSLINKIYRPYLCNMFHISKRLSSVKENYQFIDNYFPKNIIPELYKKGTIKLAELTGTDGKIFNIFISLYPNFDKEGDMDIKMVTEDNISIATITFSFIKENGQDTLFIGGIQGPVKAVDKDCIKRATKSMGGIFPKRVIMEALYNVCENLKPHMEKSCVGNERHIYITKRYLKKKHILADYDGFLETLNGEKMDSGLWKLPEKLFRKDIEDVPSKKRSEYRKRYAILDSLKEQISVIFSQNMVS